VTADAVSSAVISLGSNIGDRRGRLTAAVDQLGETVRGVSSIYRTPPWGASADIEQDDYWNAIVLVEDPTVSDPREWLRRCQALEQAARRERTVRWGPRSLDADVITVGHVVSGDPGLTLPHPLAHERAFVLLPWSEVDPCAELLGHGRIADLLETLDLSGIEKIGSVP
jgi:2-amino-4-hydroxy-6-hydroxymethyldihydropteridine diphosphokinase